MRQKFQPIPMIAPSKACTIFYPSQTGIVGSNLARDWNVYTCSSVLLCHV